MDSWSLEPGASLSQSLEFPEKLAAPGLILVRSLLPWCGTDSLCDFPCGDSFFLFGEGVCRSCLVVLNAPVIFSRRESQLFSLLLYTPRSAAPGSRHLPTSSKGPSRKMTWTWTWKRACVGSARGMTRPFGGHDCHLNQTTDESAMVSLLSRQPKDRLCLWNSSTIVWRQYKWETYGEGHRSSWNVDSHPGRRSGFFQISSVAVS